jgi:hypothetical protein
MPSTSYPTFQVRVEEARLLLESGTPHSEVQRIHGGVVLREALNTIRSRHATDSQFAFSIQQPK